MVCVCLACSMTLGRFLAQRIPLFVFTSSRLHRLLNGTAPLHSLADDHWNFHVDLYPELAVQILASYSRKSWSFSWRRMLQDGIVLMFTGISDGSFLPLIDCNQWTSQPKTLNSFHIQLHDRRLSPLLKSSLDQSCYLCQLLRPLCLRRRRGGDVTLVFVCHLTARG